MKKLDALSMIFDKEEKVLITTSIKQINVFKDEIKVFNDKMIDSSYGTYNNSENFCELSVYINGRTLHFLTHSQLAELNNK